MKRIFAFLLLMMSFAVHAALTDIKFGRFQVADSQWNVNACLNTTTCQIFSKNPGVAYRIPWTSGQVQWATGDYVRFSLSGNASFPYTAIQYSSAGVAKVTLGNGKIVNMGVDYFFFVGSDNNTGQLFSGSSGMSGSAGVTWTGTRNPTISQADAIASNSYSTVPLESGQQATTTPSNSGGGSVAPEWPATSEITVPQTASRTAARNRVSAVGLGNQVYLDERIGSSGNNINIEQTGSYNRIAGVGGGERSVIDGDNNVVVIRQGDGVGRNLLEFQVVGNTNSVTVRQARNITTGLVDGAESGGHYIGATISGNSNALTLRQANDGGAASGHFLSLGVMGSNNTGTITQSGNTAKTLFGTVTGNSNSIQLGQTGGEAFINLQLTGNNHSATVAQSGAGSHRATVNLTNSGGASTVQLTQAGAVAQNINIQQNCATLGGCSVSIVQGQ